VADRLRVVVADDHPLVRAGVCSVLARAGDIDVVAEAADTAEAWSAVVRYAPDVLVLDLHMPGEASLAAIPRFAAAAPGTAIVVLTMQAETAFARAVLSAGARGYVLKDAPAGELATALRLAVAGRTYLSPELGARMAVTPADDGPPDGLTERELQILRLIALGHTNPDIASRLYLSVRTVESHRAHLQRKTERSTRAELVRYALDHGLVDTGSPVR
jgi:two-component system response regulator NreC